MRVALVLLGMVVATPAAAVTLDFDQYAGSTQITTDSGFNFTNFYALDTVGFPASGYVNGVVSPNNVAYNSYGSTATIASATPFSLTSGYLAAAWNDGLTVTVTGSLAGATVYTQQFVVDTSHSVFTTFNSALVDSVSFATAGGTPHAGFTAGAGTELSLDNLTINGTLPPPPPPPPVNSVPEPAAWALMVAGFGLVGTALRRPARVRAA